MLTETLHTAFFDPAPKERTQKMPAGPIAGETALFGRKLCEEFAPRNEGIRLSEGAGSKPAGRATISESCGPWFAPGNRKQRLRGESSANRAGTRSSHLGISGPWFAPGNRNQRLSGESSANHAGTRSSNLGISGPWFAPGNRNQRLSGELSANHAGRPAAFSESPGPWFTCVQFCEVTFTINPQK